MHTRLAWILCLAVGIAIADFGPLVVSAHAQRSDGEDGDDEGRDRRAEWRRRWQERREGGGDEGERAERWRRFREQRDRDGEQRGDGERRGRGRDDENRSGDDNDEDEGRERSGEERGRRGGRMDYNDYARNLVRDNDKNGNMILDGEEVKQLRGPAASADANGDKSITVEEIVARLSNRESAERPGGDRTSEEGAAANESKTSTASEGGKTRVYTWLGNGPAGKDSKENAEKRKSYRFTPASERWGSASSRIKSRDRNDDGQVSMNEYSRTWSARTVREFQRYDSDGDGVITPKEATTGGDDEE
jgi:hypothetical protein